MVSAEFYKGDMTDFGIIFNIKLLYFEKNYNDEYFVYVIGSDDKKYILANNLSEDRAKKFIHNIKADLIKNPNLFITDDYIWGNR